MGNNIKPICFFIYSTCFIFAGCQETENQAEKNENSIKSKVVKEKLFIPDTSLNDILILDNYFSSERFYPTIEKLSATEFYKESPVIVFCDSLQSSYLLAYQYEGSTKNAFGCFEIGYYNTKIKGCTTLNNYKKFKTESGLQLGLSLEEVEKIKGTKYLKQNNKIIYVINDPKDVFLQKHNMPSYFLECEFSNNKIIRIKFGFEYP